MDGGRSVGIGVVFEGEEIAYEQSINPKGTVYSGELIAIENALYKIINKQVDSDLLILTDSKSSVEAIKNNRMSAHSATATLNIRETISGLKKKREDNGKSNMEERKIVIGWIPSHIGIEGNEIADQMAKEATKSQHDDRIKVPYSDWKAFYKEEMMSRTRSRNEKEGTVKGINYFREIHNKKKKKPWFAGLDVERRMLPPLTGSELTILT